jgi:hypothetical protein
LICYPKQYILNNKNQTTNNIVSSLVASIIKCGIVLVFM